MKNYLPDLPQVPGYAQLEIIEADTQIWLLIGDSGALRARRLGSSPEMLPLAERIRQIQAELPLPPNVNPGDLGHGTSPP